MAPIPSSAIGEVQEDLVKLNLKIKMANEEFDECQDDRHMEEVNQIIRQDLAEFRKKIDKLKQLAEEQETGTATEMLLKDLDNHRSQLTACQKQFREANLRCIMRLQSKAKHDLFETKDSQDVAVVRRRRSRNRESLVKETGGVTDNLTAISRQLAATVERSAMAVDELAQSSHTVTETHDEFKNMGSVIGQSRKLITKYGRRETTDRVLILIAFAFFFACVFYILRKRVLGPLDPFALAYNTLITLITSVIRLLGLA